MRKKTKKNISFGSIDLDFYEKGVNLKLVYKKFKVSVEQVDIVYLTEKELLHLNSLELKSDQLRNVRDIFCLACFTGLRSSDLHKVKSETIKDGMLYLKTEKTRDILSIPLNDYALEIIDRHVIDGKIQLDSIITNQKMNEYLKELGELSNLDDRIEQHRYSGNVKKTTTTEKHKLISTHIARRTFVTLSLEKGFRPEVVMEMTGHKNYATFKLYIKITSKVKKEEMKRLWGKLQW